jgi:hypothetical protein
MGVKYPPAQSVSHDRARVGAGGAYSTPLLSAAEETYVLVAACCATSLERKIKKMLYWRQREVKVRIRAVFSSRQWTDLTWRRLTISPLYYENPHWREKSCLRIRRNCEDHR